MPAAKRLLASATTGTSVAAVFFFVITLLVLLCEAAFATPAGRWVELPSDSKETVRDIIQAEVNRHGFSTQQEDNDNTRGVEEEKSQTDSESAQAAYEADAGFKSARARRDALTAQYQRKAGEAEEAEKNIKNIGNTLGNLDSSLLRYESDLAAQQESMKKRMKEMKQGEVVVATIYRIGFKDKKHDLEKLADMVSSPLMSEYMGVFIRSFTEVVNDRVIADYINSIAYGTQRWISENPITITLASDNQGTTFLRIKRYELYPFQEWQDKRTGIPSSVTVKAAIVSSAQDVLGFAQSEGFMVREGGLAAVASVIQQTNSRNAESKRDCDDLLGMFQENLRSLEERIKSTKLDRLGQQEILARRADEAKALNAEMQTAQAAKERADLQMEERHARLRQVNNLRETVIIQPAFAAIKGEQTPADACSETIIDKLEQVKNNARIQHSSTTTTVVSNQYLGGKDTQEFKEARITSVKFLSFLNKGGEQVEVKVAFRVRTVMEDLAAKEPPTSQPKRVSGGSKPASPATGGPGPLADLELVSVPGGCYLMGDTFDDGYGDEKPVHEVCVGTFLIGKYPVTQGQWKKVTSENPSYFSSCGADCPVEQVSWHDVQGFIRCLNRQSGGKYRLPTEAEWEYACRSGGKHEKYCGGNDVDAVAWYSGNSGSRTHPVGQKKPNDLGIYDMSGNVWQWVQDLKGDYGSGPQKDPQGPKRGPSRVGRGGSWGRDARQVRATHRGVNDPDAREYFLGFRLVAPAENLGVIGSELVAFPERAGSISER